MKSSQLVELGTISTENFFGKKSIKQVTKSMPMPNFQCTESNCSDKTSKFR